MQRKIDCTGITGKGSAGPCETNRTKNHQKNMGFLRGFFEKAGKFGSRQANGISQFGKVDELSTINFIGKLKTMQVFSINCPIKSFPLQIPVRKKPQNRRFLSNNYLFMAWRRVIPASGLRPPVSSLKPQECSEQTAECGVWSPSLSRRDTMLVENAPPTKCYCPVGTRSNRVCPCGTIAFFSHLVPTGRSFLWGNSFSTNIMSLRDITRNHFALTAKPYHPLPDDERMI